jgi:ATP synthase F0 subunit b
MMERQMKFFYLLCLVVVGAAVLVAFLPDIVLAAEAGEAHIKAFDLTEEGFKILNTLIAFAILYKVAAKPLSNFLKDRSEGIRKSLAEAEQARKEAVRQLEEQRSKVADLEAELNRVRDTGEKERQAMRVRLLADQETQGERLLEQTRSAIELETAKAQAELRDRAAEISLGLAEEMLKKNIGLEDQDRFVSDYLANLESSSGGAL